MSFGSAKSFSSVSDSSGNNSIGSDVSSDSGSGSGVNSQSDSGSGSGSGSGGSGNSDSGSDNNNSGSGGDITAYSISVYIEVTYDGQVIDPLLNPLISGQKVGAGVVDESGESDGGLLYLGTEISDEYSASIFGSYNSEEDFIFTWNPIGSYNMVTRRGGFSIENTGETTLQVSYTVDAVENSFTLAPGELSDDIFVIEESLYEEGYDEVVLNVSVREA